MTTATCYDEVAEAARKQVRRCALLKPGIALAHDFQDEAQIIPLELESKLARPLRYVDQGLRALQTVGRDLLRHHIKEDAIFGRSQRRGLAGLVNACDR